MELERIFFARYAEITPDGLFTAVGGGMNRIDARGFPWCIGFLFLLIEYRVSAEEAGRQHVMAVERDAPNGRTEPVGPDFPMIPLPPYTAPGPDGKFVYGLSYLLTNAAFPHPGVYTYRLKIDGDRIGEVQLLVAGRHNPGSSKGRHRSPARGHTSLWCWRT
jgi:hypothetical protein